MCFFIFHKHTPVSVFHYYDVSWGDKVPSTTIIYTCERCGHIKKKDLYGVGFLELEDLK